MLQTRERLTADSSRLTFGKSWMHLKKRTTSRMPEEDVENESSA